MPDAESGHRARVACKVCNARRVKCDRSFSGNPCSNCRRAGARCELIVSRRGKYVTPVTLSPVEAHILTLATIGTNGQARVGNLTHDKRPRGAPRHQYQVLTQRPWTAHKFLVQQPALQSRGNDVSALLFQTLPSLVDILAILRARSSTWAIPGI